MASFTKTQIGIAVGTGALLVLVFVGYLWWLNNQGPVLARADGRGAAVAEFRRFRARWQRDYDPMVRQTGARPAGAAGLLLPARHVWKKVRTTNVIERCFGEVRRRTRPMVCFVNPQSVDHIIYSIFQRFNLEWKTRTLKLFTQAA
jgi:transposase-like protein